MKFAIERPYADPDKAARKLVAIASTVEAVQDGRIHIELIICRSCVRAAASTNTTPALTARLPTAGFRSIDPVFM